MSACEYCWERSWPIDGNDYGANVRRAEAEGWPCTKNTEEGARLRAGQFWDEETKCDSRLALAPASPKSAVPDPENSSVSAPETGEGA